MSLFRRPQPERDAVDVFARLAGYEATSTDGLNGRYASGYTYEPSISVNTSATAELAVPGHIAAPVHVPEERRGATRYDLQLSVRAKSRAEDDWQVGVAIDASVTGLCIEMPCPPDETHLDVEIDSTETITAWARVVGVSLLAEGVFRWRLRLVSYDASYSALLRGLDPLASPDDEPTMTPVPVEDERELVDAVAGRAAGPRPRQTARSSGRRPVKASSG